MSRYTAVDTDLQRKCGQSLENHLGAFSLFFRRSVESVDLRYADFGGSAESKEAAESCFETLSAVSSLVNGLRLAGFSHAEKLRRSAAARENAEAEGEMIARDVDRL